MKGTFLTGLLLAAGLGLSSMAQAAEYRIDRDHSSIQFRIMHFDFSWLHGRFETFSGEFSFDKDNPGKSKIVVDIDPASVNTSFARRDRVLRSAGILNVKKFPSAQFESSTIGINGNSNGVLRGNLTLHGVTREVAIDVEYIGGGRDPWGRYRQGFVGTTEFALADFGILYNLGPLARTVEMTFNIEGIRK